MKLTSKRGGENGGDAEPVHMPFDAAMAGINSGAYDLAGYAKDNRDSDLPAAQSPAPGTDPIGGGRERATDGDKLTNMARVTGRPASGGLATSKVEMPPAISTKPAAQTPAKGDAK